ncbi:MAG: hypothetical protein R3B70_02905 [Polyangiaceae bacterium]
MSAVEDILLKFIDRRLEAMLRCPEMWGTDEAVELQVLQLLRIRALTLRPQSESKRPRATLDAYGCFLRRKFPKDGVANLAALLEQRGEQNQLSAILAEFRAEMAQRVTPQNPFDEHDIVLVLSMRRDVQVPRASTVTSFYDRFHSVMRALTRERGTRGRGTRELEMAIDFAMPTIHVHEANGKPARVLIPLDQPAGARELSYEGNIRGAMSQLATITRWAVRPDEPVKTLQASLNDDVNPRSLAAQALRLMPGEEAAIETVKIGGRLSGARDPMIMRPDIARRVVEVVREGQAPRAFEETGSLRAVDIDQGSMRLTVERGSKKVSIACWVEDRDIISFAREMLARTVRVWGLEYQSPTGRSFVIVERMKPL